MIVPTIASGVIFNPNILRENIPLIHRRSLGYTSEYYVILFVRQNISKLNQSVNDTEAHPKLAQVDCELKILKSARQFYAQARALSNKPNKI